MVAALVIVSMVSQVSLAQREEGRRGRGGPGGGPGGGLSAGRLLGVKEVQAALKLTEDQTSKLEKINEESRDKIREAMQDGGDRAKMQELMASTTTKVNEVLDEGQQKRLMGILVQVDGAGALTNPAIAKELNITNDQKKKFEEVRESNRAAMREAREGDRDQEGAREKMAKLREESNKKLMAVLTSDQQAQLEAMKGEKVEIDMSALRGGGGPGGRGGDRQRGERGRGDRNPEAKSEEKASN